MVLYEKDRNISKKNCTSHIFCFMIQEEVNHEKLIYNFTKIFMTGAHVASCSLLKYFNMKLYGKMICNMGK